MADTDPEAGALVSDAPLMPPPSSPPPHPPPSLFFSQNSNDGSGVSSSPVDEEGPPHALAQAQDSGKEEDQQYASTSTSDGKSPVLSDFNFRTFLMSSSAQAEGLARSVVHTTDQALQSARSQIGSISQASSEHLDTAQSMAYTGADYYKKYEDMFFGHVKEGIRIASGYPTVAGTVATAASLLLMRSPRRFLFRMTLGRFRSEEAMLANAENKVKEMRQSVDLLKNESKKLEERAKLAEEELQRGRTKLKSTGGQLATLVKSVYKTESSASGLMTNLRELPGQEALKLRAEVAVMTAEAKKQRQELNKTMAKIAGYGIPV